MIKRKDIFLKILEKIKQIILLRLLKSRMHQIAFVLPADQLDIEEANAIIRLIKIINCKNDPNYFTTDKALKRFWKYYNWRTLMERKLHGSDFNNTAK